MGQAGERTQGPYSTVDRCLQHRKALFTARKAFQPTIRFYNGVIKLDPLSIGQYFHIAVLLATICRDVSPPYPWAPCPCHKSAHCFLSALANRCPLIEPLSVSTYSSELSTFLGPVNEGTSLF